MKISVFGSSKTQPGSGDYQDALALGRGLALAGHTVMTGGYMGTMEALSRGAAQTGGQVIGVTCRQIESWRPVKPNAWLTSEVKRDTLIERLMYLIGECDLAIALPGGIGTLTEIAMCWNLIVINVNSIPPILLVGQGWRETFGAFYEYCGDHIPLPDRDHLIFCTDIPETLEKVRKYAPSQAGD